MKNIILFLITLTLLYNAKAQEKEDTRSKNRRFADSMYYEHTIKKQISESKKTDTTALKKLSITPNSQNTIKNTNEIPSSTLYQHKWITERVKDGNVSLKDLPDEITIRLCGKNNNEKFCFPYKGCKTSSYGWRWGRAHTGVDIALDVGDTIYAAFDGVVRVSKYNGGYGNMVLIRHYNNLETLYGHMSVLKVKVGQKVKAGDVIGLGGSTGRSTGPHLHFECRLLYACIDPEWIVDISNNCLKTKILKIDKSFFGVAGSLSLAQNKTKPTKLAKVNKCLEGTKYVSQSELNSLVAKKEKKKNEFAVINNKDKSTWRYYQVKNGDTIENICSRYHIKKEDFLTINNDVSELKENQRVRIR
ncbi:MAG: M23 family metallopeptidase [Bacteroidota bacterium]|nr:M23 family metallopeptidase [Bacteroidota bacterium]